MADMAGNGEIVFYQRDNGKPGIDVRMDSGTVWLTQAQMAELFQTTPQNITLHLKAIFAEGELTETATCKDYLQVRQEGARQVERNLRHYNLVAILSAGVWTILAKMFADQKQALLEKNAPIPSSS